MKITKDGTIEPCCDKTKEFKSYFVVQDNTIWATIVLVYDWESDVIFDYCPFCGAKTEVEK